MRSEYYANVSSAADEVGRLKSILEEIRSTIGATMGPGGRNVSIGTLGGRHIVTKDGVTVSSYLKYRDGFKNLISGMVNDAALSTVRLAGDGTTTCAVLSTSLMLAFMEMYNDPTARPNLFSISRELQDSADMVVGYLKENRKFIESQEGLDNISKISCNNDEELAKIVSAAVWEAGVDGAVLIQKSKGEQTYRESTRGYSFPTTPFSENFIKDKGAGSTVLDNPVFLIIDGDLESYDEITDIWKEYIEKYVSSAMKREDVRPLVMIVNDIKGKPLATVVRNIEQVPIYCVKCPDFLWRREQLLDDIRFITGTHQVFSNIKGRTLDSFGADFMAKGTLQLKDMKWKEFGTATKCTITKDRCVIVSEVDVTDRVAGIKKAAEASNVPEDDLFLKSRVSRLVSGVGTIFVGAYSESEQGHREGLVDDSVRACFAALREGVLPGAGHALKYACSVLPVSSLLKTACSAPFDLIRKNLGVKESSAESEGHWIGNNPLLDTQINFNDAGIVDPYLVTETALLTAVSVAKQLITTEKFILPENEY